MGTSASKAVRVPEECILRRRSRCLERVQICPQLSAPSRPFLEPPSPSHEVTLAAEVVTSYCYFILYFF